MRETTPASDTAVQSGSGTNDKNSWIGKVNRDRA